jgi:FAD/FMN-containing dehydrogenase/Fe-S oxidoreductase
MNWHISPAQDPYQQKTDVKGLERALRQSVRGEVRFDQGTRAMYAQDASNYRHVPIGVVLPRDKDDVVAAVAACHRFGAPIVSRGGGTGLCGQTCNVAVVLDHSKYFNRIVELNAEEGFARVEPGVVLDDLRSGAEKHHLTFGPDPATHDHCTLGGMIGNNSCGVHSIMAGRTADNVLELEVLTYDGIRLTVGTTSDEELERLASRTDRIGEIYRTLRDIRDTCADEVRKRFPDIPRRVSGYNLDQLLPENNFNLARALVGTEGTCVTVLEAKVRLVHSPPKRSLLILGYPDVFHAADHVLQVLAHRPVGLEGIDGKLVEFMKRKGLHTEYLHLLPKGDGWLLVEFGGSTKEESDAKARGCMEALAHSPDTPTMELYDDPELEREVWLMRESGLGATANVPDVPLGWPGWEDAAVDPAQVGAYLREFKKLLDKFGYIASLYGHFGDGCVHCRISFDLFSKSGVDDFMRFIGEAADLVLRHGGSLSGEHGDGQSKAVFLPRMYGELITEQFRRFKKAWDPQWKMNPGKIVDPWLPDEHLRLGPTYSPHTPKTHFTFLDDKESLPRATLRCVGVGKCRRKEDAFMCPSFLVTHEERDSTRGRARLLQEMLRGDLITDGWHSLAVAEGLDLCLGCKGCKKECPVNVDMATYKSEFLSHQHVWTKSRAAWSMGLIGRWAPVGSAVPEVANFMTHAPVLRDISKGIAGVSRTRELPRFAGQSFRRWHKTHTAKGAGDRGEVVLLPDEFNDVFLPDTLKACVHVLEQWGYRVVVPEARLGGIRPLIHYGWLKQATARSKHMVAALCPQLQAGTPIIMAEPSTVSVFRDELRMLMPGDRDAKRACDQSFLLSEFIMDRDLPLPKLSGHAIFHGHCHQKAVLRVEAMRGLLKGMGLSFDEPQPGCCGMAGSFGYETRHADISRRIGETALLPDVRKASPDTLLVADGFSCRHQIEHGTGRKPLHSAELLQLAFAGTSSTQDPR